MDKEERRNWILEKMKTQICVDILNQEFVDAYIAFTGAPHVVTAWGANRCPQLAADLKTLYESQVLSRTRIGIGGGSWQPGFPKWVWCYMPKIVGGRA